MKPIAFMVLIALCTCLLLSGCQLPGLLAQVREEASSMGQGSGEDLSSVPQSAPEKPAEGSAFKPRPNPGPSEPAQSPPAEDILQKAGPDDLMAVLQNPESAAYRSLGEAVAEIDDFGSGDGAGYETILIVPLKDNVRITVEEVWLDYSLNFMYLVDTLGAFSGKPGEHLALHTFLAEGIPHTRVVAQLGGQYAVWDCRYDGLGVSDVTYISAKASPEPIDEFSSGFHMLSAAAAVSASIFAEGYERITPEELGELPGCYWQTVAHALTMYQENSEGDFDPYSGELMGVSAWLTDACRLALFPGTEGKSVYSQGGTVYREANEYWMDPCSYGDSIFWEHIASESSVDGKTGSVVIAVTSPDSSPDPVTYRVEWAVNETIDIYTPFPYHLTAISKIEGN